MSKEAETIIVRRVKSPHDLQSVYLIEQASFSNPYSFELLEFLAKMYGETFFVAEVYGKIAGYIIFIIRKNYLGHILSIAIDPLYRRTGIASKLIKKAEKYLSKRNVLVLRLEVRLNNLIARKFYLKLGFKDGYIIPNYYANGESAQVMFKLLKQEK